MRRVLSAYAVICLTLCAGSRNALAQASEAVCVEVSVIRQCETDARRVDELEAADKRAAACQRQLDTTDGSLQECQTTSQREATRATFDFERVAREAGARTVERDHRPEWLHVAAYITGALLIGAGAGFILGRI